ncbi:ribosome silencing factor [Rickettsiales bacterium]|nr:ribosome silencing factor [Rickettsiales bacterium]
MESSLEDGKADDVVTIDLCGKADIADYMIIASGNSTRHTSSLAEKIVQKIKSDYSSDVSVEGIAAGDWVLVDAGDIIVHIFKHDIRGLYDLEKMWSVPVPAAVASEKLTAVV